MKVIGVIPARYESTRFPGKPLIDIMGKPMIQRVYERAQQSDILDLIIVATDDQRIFECVESFGGRVKMTMSDHISGTDRIAEIAADFDENDLIINIQGDEPLLEPSQLNQLARLLQSDEAQIATLARWIDEDKDIYNPNAVKVVCNIQGKALYFSRSTIPFNRSGKSIRYRQHIGLYGFRNQTLQQLTKLDPSDLELCEKLEQLRWLENGFSIFVGMSEEQNIGIDTPEDLQRILQLMKDEG